MKFRLVEDTNKLIAYNGSDKKFDEFSDDSKGETIGTDNFDIPGIYFSNDKEYAKDFACGSITGEWEDENGETHTVTRKSHTGYLYTCELNYKKPYIIDANYSNDKQYWEEREHVAKNIKKYIDDGYDIVMMIHWQYLDNKGNLIDKYGDEYVVLNPDIIKIIDIEECAPEKEE